MPLTVGQPFDFSDYLKEKPSICFETDWDKETYDWTNKDLEVIRPRAFNQPAAFFKYLGRLRKQPVFDRFFVPPVGRIVIKLLESRLYPMCMDFIFSQFELCPSSVRVSRYNWQRGFTKPLKPVVKALCELFEEGNTLIVYNINKQTIVGVISAAQYTMEDLEEDDQTADPVLSDGAHCEDRFVDVMQTLNLDKYLKIHLLLVDQKLSPLTAKTFTFGLIKGLVAWSRFCMPKSKVRCIITHPDERTPLPLYRHAGFGVVSHSDKSQIENDVLLHACFLVNVISYDDEEWNTHKFHGIIKY